MNNKQEKVFGLSLWEIGIVQVILYLVVWLVHEYIATLLTVVFIPIFASILVISIIAELIEKSRVPRIYFVFLVISIIIPVIIGLFFLSIYNGNLDWLDK